MGGCCRGVESLTPVGRFLVAGGAANIAGSLFEGTGGKRVPGGHLREAQSDPQVGSETSTDHGSGLYDD